MRPTPPDIGLLATDWQPRALIRAQLIEEGLEVVATNTWSMMRRHLRPGIKPKLVLVDLKGLPCPEDVLANLRVLMKPDRVLVLTAIGTVDRVEIARMGFHALSRPVPIDEVVRTAARLIGFHGEKNSA